MNQRLNHPKKGSTIKVEPFRELKDIHTIKRLLAGKPRDLALFTIGINTNLRASDLLNLKAGQVRDVQPGQDIEIREQKTGKLRRLTLNKACVSVLQRLLVCGAYEDQDYLFQGQRGRLTVSYLNRMVKGWARLVNLKGNYGSHSLRKTFGYIKHTVQGATLPELMMCFNHASQKQTLDYLCIQDATIRNIYMTEI